MKRYALVSQDSAIPRYLPENYSVQGYVRNPAGFSEGTYVLVSGVDVAGWTLDGYVIPRLRSGNIGAREIGPDEVPALVAGPDGSPCQ